MQIHGWVLTKTETFYFNVGGEKSTPLFLYSLHFPIQIDLWFFLLLFHSWCIQQLALWERNKHNHHLLTSSQNLALQKVNVSQHSSTFFNSKVHIIHYLLWPLNTNYKSEIYFVFYFAEIANHLSYIENNNNQFKW